MAYKFETEKLQIPRELKRTVKISLAEREIIKKEYKTNPNTSYNKLAKKWNVSKRLIYFIVNPEKERIQKLQQKEKRKKYYDKNKQRDFGQKHRKYKKKLYNKNLLKKKSL